MTLGSASSGTSCELDPARAFRRRRARGTRATNTVSSSGKCVNTCVTTPGSLRHFGLPNAARPRARRRHRNHATSRCPALRSCCRADPFPGAGAAARGRRRAARRRPRRGAAGLRASAPCAGRSPARRARARRKPRSTDTARRPASSASRCVAPRSISACAKSPVRCGGISDAASRLMTGFAAGNSSSTANSRVTTRSTLPSTGTAGRIEGDRADRRRGVVADAGQRAQRFEVVAEIRRRAVRPPRARRRAGCGRARNSRARPRRAARRRAGAAASAVDRRPARQEFGVIGPDRLHGGLLQHDLRQPDPVGIGALARARPPRQHAAVAVVPGEQIGRGRRARGFLSPRQVGLLRSWRRRWHE